MPKCRKCGQEISEPQYKSLKGKCPRCSLLKHIRTSTGWVVFIATAAIILTFLIYIAVRLLI